MIVYNYSVVVIISSLIFLFLFPLNTIKANVADNKQNTSTIEGIINSCFTFLESHLCEGKKWNKNFHFYRPSLEKYSADQW